MLVSREGTVMKEMWEGDCGEWNEGRGLWGME